MQVSWNHRVRDPELATRQNQGKSLGELRCVLLPTHCCAQIVCVSKQNDHYTYSQVIYCTQLINCAVCMTHKIRQKLASCIIMSGSRSRWPNDTCWCLIAPYCHMGTRYDCCVSCKTLFWAEVVWCFVIHRPDRWRKTAISSASAVTIPQSCA